MKDIRTRLSGIALLLCIAIPALAANSESVRLSLHSNTNVNGVVLKPGDYRLQIDRNDNAVKITFVQGKKELVTASGSFVTKNEFVQPVAAVTQQDGPNRIIREIWISKIKGAIVLDQTAGSGSSSVSAQ